MYPHSHFLFPLLVGFILEKFGFVDYTWILVAVFVGVFIDLDHWIHHIFVSGELSPWKAWHAGVVEHEPERTFIHHKEGMVMMTAISVVLFFVFPYWVSGIALGYYSHMLLDHYSLTKGFLDYMTDKAYWSGRKPFRFKVVGLQINLAKHEVFFDMLLVFGLVVVYFV